jgi:hypothetical protein
MSASIPIISGRSANELTSESAVLAQIPNLPQELPSTRVLVRFALRVMILVIFAASARIEFGKALAALLWMSIILCAVVGAMRREPPFGPVLNHWDEMAAYAAIFALISIVDQATPA